MKKDAYCLRDTLFQCCGGLNYDSEIFMFQPTEPFSMLRKYVALTWKRGFCWCYCMQFSSVQSLSHVRLFATPWITACQASLSISNSRSSLKLRSIKQVMQSSHQILCHPLLLLPAIPPSIRVFSNESTLHMRWRKYWSFSFSIIPSKEIPGLISFRMDWLDLLAVQGTLKSLSNTTVQKCDYIKGLKMRWLFWIM